MGAATTQSRVEVAIVGAGLTGMAAAHHLRQAGVGVRLLEARDVPGGHAVTVEERGYRFDRTGHLLHAADPETLALARAWIGPGCLEIERRSRVWSHGAYTRYPFQANLHGLPPAVAYECLMGYLAAARGPAAPAPGETFEGWCLRHFGTGICRHFMFPYNGRLWGVPPGAISAEWCARFVPVPTLEDVVAGAVGLADRELGYNARFLYPRRGIGALSEGLARAAGPIELGRAPVLVDLERRELVLPDERIGFEVLVSTAPLPELLRLCRPLPDAVAAAGARLRKTHLYYLDVALRSPCLVPYHWIYVPEARYPFYRVGCYSNFSDAMAPPGAASLYVELAERREPDLRELLPAVAAGLCEMGVCRTPESVLFARLRRIEHAYVLYDDAYAPSLAAIRPFLAEARVLSTGRYGGWNYSSMGDALGFGRDAAREAQVLLGAGSRTGGEAPP
ncbi:MAG: NAD(P)-binding protein [Polyangiaceae bacterium]|nr:NAD(P)-binding protein [Polyangiaceae bacterium]